MSETDQTDIWTVSDYLTTEVRTDTRFSTPGQLIGYINGQKIGNCSEIEDRMFSMLNPAMKKVRLELLLVFMKYPSSGQS